ncbi:ABC transporter permease [Chryseobacterium suipulveris]|uniref:ABC transporter permease n=1 Tax=Chryseobacterium suipulveris TaxID=2929800 RepID=A0ABY4BP06_9FLAO|nr:ABC transporter permease [Chryseobacterium suipulveris]UOE40830.1 ABC transporter permease [Chryseobacterium suipulveris]
MLYKLWRAIWKEILLLKRDIGGIVIIFVMPLVLIITITLIQDSSFKSLEGSKMPMILVDNDKGEISQTIINELKAGKTFEIVSKNYDENTAKKAVYNGEYQLAIVIPKDLSNDLNAHINQKVEEIVSQFGAEVQQNTSLQQIKIPENKEIHLYFDPATNPGFKSGIINTVDKMIFKIENKKIYKAFQEQLGTGEDLDNSKNFITYKEVTPKAEDNFILPNSVQHNVPAWALFAIFFIVVPLSINLVKEKNQGTIIRLNSSPTPYFIHVLGKTFTYLVICIIQFLLMVAVGIYLFPYFDLPVFEVGGKLAAMLFVTFFAGLGAIGIGVLLGTLAETQEQSAPFGATSVVILAAIGGIWVPVFMMPEFMQLVSKFSPMNWGLNAYYDIILRNSGIQGVLKYCGMLFLFYLVMVSIALIYEKRKNAS